MGSSREFSRRTDLRLSSVHGSMVTLEGRSPVVLEKESSPDRGMLADTEEDDG